MQVLFTLLLSQQKEQHHVDSGIFALDDMSTTPLILHNNGHS